MAKDTKENQALPEGQAEKPKKKSKVKRLVIFLAILIMTLSGAGLGGYWWLYLRAPSEATEGAQPEGAEQSHGASESGTQQGQAGQSGHGSPAGEASGGSARIERQSDLPRSAGQVLPLPTITVNLSDPGGRRYLKLGMEVEVNADVSAIIKNQAAKIRDSIIMLLAGKTYADISTPDGKVLLKAEVAARLNQIFGAQRVIRVYFTDFVVN